MHHVSSSLNGYARSKLGIMEKLSLDREVIQTVRTDSIYVERGGRRLVSFCCNDYFGLSRDSAVIESYILAARKYGAGAGASRLITGSSPPLHALERTLADFKNTQAAIVFGSGYLTNLGVIPALTGPGDLVIIDRLAHSCIHAGARLSGAQTEIFDHNDTGHAESLLKTSTARHKLIVTETVFSMDGDRAPVSGLSALAGKYDAWLMTDDAHGLAIYPESGVQADLQTGTLSKAAGSYGGYLCSSKPVIELMKNRARSFIFSTGLPPASAAAADTAIRIMMSDRKRCSRPLENARTFCSMTGLPVPESHIVPVMTGDADKAVALSRDLETAGYLVSAIRPPTVPKGTSRLRITFSAAHRKEDISGLSEALKSCDISLFCQ